MREPPRPARARRALVAASLLVGGVALAAVAAGAGDDLVATVSTPAERVVMPSRDLVVIFDVGEIDADVVRAAERVAAASGGQSTLGRTGSLGMRAVTRDGDTVHAPPAGYLVPTTYIAFPEGAARPVLGAEVAALLGPGRVAMNELTAEMTGARAGDTIVMQAADGSAVPLTVAGIRPYSELGGSELAFDYDVAQRLGATYDTRVVIHGADRRSLDGAIAAEGLHDRRDTRVARSWDPPNPDSTMSTPRAKATLGAPWYRFNTDGSISVHPDWIAANLPPERELLNDTIRVRARCHVKIVDDLRAALAAVAAAGLGAEIDVANANTYGGCYAGARFSRLSDGQIGFLSRHTYAMAWDTNTVANCFGCVPRMHCDVVRIFRRHGFAWGGNFRRPDGMHFEWVGERRDQIRYPSTYCPNTPPALAESAAPTEVGREVLTAGETGDGQTHSGT